MPIRYGMCPHLLVFLLDFIKPIKLIQSETSNSKYVFCFFV